MPMRVVIVGSGAVGSSIARELLAHDHEVLLIDTKPEAIGRSGLQGAGWLIGDACELSTLTDADLDHTQVVVSATGDDKVNLVVSLLAKTEFGVGRTVARVNNPKNDWMFDDAWGVDVAVSTPRMMTAMVEEAVEVGDIVRLLTLRAGVSSLVEFTVPEESPLAGRTMGLVDWPEESTAVAILRDEVPIAPSEDDVIEGGDQLFFLTSIDAEDALRAVLAGGGDLHGGDGSAERSPHADPDAAPSDAAGSKAARSDGAGADAADVRPAGSRPAGSTAAVSGTE